MSSASIIADFIRNNDNFLISTHVFPDGDNIGSALTLSDILRAMGKNFTCYIEGTIPKMYSWMPGTDHINDTLTTALDKLKESGEDPTLLIIDCGAIHRMGDAFSEWITHQNNLQIANIDHHISNSQFGTVNWVDPGYSSTGEMVYEIMKELDIELTLTIAQNLFVSVYTDTGRFSFSNTSARSLRYAAEYIEHGAKPVAVFHKVFANRTLSSFQLQTESFKTLTMFLDGKGCYFYVDQKMRSDTGTTFEDTEGFIDTVRTLRGFQIVLFFKEIAPGDIRVSTRAAPPINASMLMSLFGGGGHPRAAGCRICKPLPEAIQLFISRAEEAINSGEVLEKG